jgi:RNA polymerase sigma-70 factor, ECF subfamily
MRATQPPLQDPEAFSNLYTHSQIIIFRFIYGMHGGPVEEVEDLTCDTFMRAWKGRGRFFGDDHEALCWLFTIARHLVIDAHRRRKSHPDDNQGLLDDSSLDALYRSSQLTPEEHAANREQFTHLWHILQNLSDDKREMLVLRYMLGWKVKQIADYLQKEENTISVNIRRCLEQIRHAW